MSKLRRPADFPRVSNEDQISLDLTVPTANPDSVEFQLESTANITAWKGLELRMNTGITVKRETHDHDHGPHTISVQANDLVGARLTLAKAKWFGIPTGMYHLENLSAHQGQRLQFLWQRDDPADGPVVGFFRDVGHAINEAADTVADVVETVGKTVGEVISTGIEAIGTALSDALDAIGNLLGEIPGIGIGFRFIFHWLGTILSATFDFLATLIKGVIDVFASLLAGVIRIVGGLIGGLLSGDWRLFLEGLGDIVAGVVSYVIAIFGKLIALIQAVVFMQLGERPLTRNEAELLTRVYRRSVALYNVRIIDGFAGVFSINNLPFTLGNKIYMKNRPAGNAYLTTLVHECCHVWQNQHLGFRYLADAIWAQWTLPGAGYPWQDELVRGHFRWQDFNKEAQARFLDHVFSNGTQIPALGTLGEFYNDDPIGHNVTFITGGPNFRGLARESVAYVRSAWWPIHR